MNGVTIAQIHTYIYRALIQVMQWFANKTVELNYLSISCVKIRISQHVITDNTDVTFDHFNPKKTFYTKDNVKTEIANLLRSDLP